MAGNLMRAGHRVIGYDMLARRRQDHRRAGGQAAPSCRDVGSHAGTVVCSLPSSEALLQTAAELAESSPPPRIVIDTSTLPIAVKEQARRSLGARGTILLDCPLSGTGAQARAKDLVVYASGDRGAYRRVGSDSGGVRARPLLRRRVRRRVEDEVRRQPARRDSQRRRGRSARARHEGRSRSGDGREGHRRRRGQLTDVPGAWPDDGEGRLLRMR